MNTILRGIFFALIFSSTAWGDNSWGNIKYKFENNCAISFSPVDKETKTFPLDLPNRFVIDIPVKVSKVKNRTDVTPDNCITSIRFGAHDDFARIVLDLKDNSSVKDFSLNNGKLNLFFIKSETIKESPSATPSSLPIFAAIELSATPTIPPSPTQIISPTFANSPIPSQPSPTQTEASITTEEIKETSPIPTISPTPSFVENLEPKASQQLNDTEAEELKLQKIQFNQNQTLELSFSTTPDFTLLKKSSMLYWITIPNAALGSDEVKLPYFAPQEFPGIVSILAKKIENDLIVSVKTEQNTQLFCYRERNSLILKKE